MVGHGPVRKLSDGTRNVRLQPDAGCAEVPWTVVADSWRGGLRTSRRHGQHQRITLTNQPGGTRGADHVQKQKSGYVRPFEGGNHGKNQQTDEIS